MAELSEYLNGEAPPKVSESAAVSEPATATEAAPPTEAPPERARDESGRFTKAEQEAEAADKALRKPEEAAPKPAKPPEVTGLEAGIAAERSKRQEAERRLAEYETQRAQEAAARANPPPDPATNLHGWAAHVQGAQQGAAVDQMLNVSEMLMRDKHGDEAVDAAQQQYLAELRKDPAAGAALHQQFLAQRNPYGWLMKWQARQSFLAEAGDDPAAYRSKLEAEIRAKVEAEFGQRQPAAAPAFQAPPSSLANARSNGRVSEPVWSGPPPLSSLFKR